MIIYIITSTFHYGRAKKISEKNLDIEIKWILCDAKLDDSEYWEKIYINNVENDIKNK